MTLREVVLVVGTLLAGQFAIGAFEEWRAPLQWLSRVVCVAFMVFYPGRAFWRWWRGVSQATVGGGVWVALAFAGVSWIDLALARGVAGMSEGNYALIIIGPLMMLLGAFVSLGGIVAAGLATGAFIRAVRRSMPKRAWIIAGAIVAVVLNLTPIVLLVKTFEGH